jgi:hypothetical protein
MTTHVTLIHRSRTVHLHEMNEGGMFPLSLCGTRAWGVSVIPVRFCAKCDRINKRLIAKWLKSNEAKEKR